MIFEQIVDEIMNYEARYSWLDVFLKIAIGTIIELKNEVEWIFEGFKTPSTMQVKQAESHPKNNRIALSVKS